MSPIPVEFPLSLYLYAGMLLATVVVIWLGRVSARQAGWQWGGWRTVLQAAGWGGLLAVAGVAWLRFLLQTGRYLPVPVHPSPVDGAMLVLVIPFVEEVFFRGAVFAGLQRTWSLFWALVLSTACSVACLPMQIWLVFIFLSGIGYALAFRLSGSIFAPILAHALVAAVFLMARMHPGAVGTLATRPLWIAAGAAMVVILLGLIPGKARST